MLVPQGMMDMPSFERKWRTCYAERLGRYGLSPARDRVEDFFHALHREGSVDFGLLSEDLQRGVIRKAATGRKSRLELVGRNPFLDGMFSLNGTRDIVEANRDIVMKEFSLAKTAARLIEVYETVLSLRVTHRVDKGAVVSAFNAPEKNHLLLCPSAYG
jgi:hypothetical protein